MKRNVLDVTPSVGRPPAKWGAVTKSYTYENNTGVPVYVTEPNGVYTIVNPKRNVISPNAFVVYVTYHALSGAANLIGIASSLPVAAYRNLCAELDKTGESTLMYVIEDPIPILRGEAIEILSLGLTFSKSQLELDKTPVRRNRSAGELTLGVAVVQNHTDTRPIRWVRYYNAIVEVVPVKAQYHEEGTYLIISGDHYGRSMMVHFEFDCPLSPLRCFETEEEARNFNWAQDAIPCIDEMKKKLTRQLEESESALAERKAELELEHKRQMNEIAVEREASLANFKNLENKMKSRAEERKDTFDERSTVRKDMHDERSTVRKEHYETRSMNRKDASDTLKVIPAVITAGVALIAMLM